jgi:hypothetical protein
MMEKLLNNFFIENPFKSKENLGTFWVFLESPRRQ